MGFGNSSLFLKIVFILLIIALVLEVLAIALPYWYSTETGNWKYYGGLWKTCSDGGSAKCSKLKTGKLPDWFEAVRAFNVIGLILIVLALVVTIVVIFIKSEMKVLKLVGFILSFAAFFCLFLAVCIYGGKADTVARMDEYSGAFALCIIAFIVLLVAGVLGALDYIGKGK